MKQKKSGGVMTAVVIIAFLAGLSLLLYPTLSSYWNTMRQAQSISAYDEEVGRLRREEYDRLRRAAEEYNRALLDRPSRFALTEELAQQYPEMLLTGGSDVMAYLEIPVLDLTLPIRHGVEKDTLQRSVGHLEWSSLPVGGESTHCVLSGHRGLPSSELLTNIDRLEEGDLFYLHVLGETLKYRVDRFAVVEPDDFSLLGIEEGEDYVTLLTCTPYGINSHRLLVRGVRVQEGTEGSAGTAAVNNELRLLDTRFVLALILAPALALAFILLLCGRNTKKREERGEDEKP